MSFINKLIKKGTFYFIFVFLFFVFFGQSKAFALTCTTKELNDKSEYLVLNARSAWSDTGVKIICDGREQENIIVKTETINGTTSEKSTQYGSNIINSVVSKPGFYKVTYSLESDPTVMVVRQIRVLPNNLNDAIVTWNGDTDSLNTAENDEFIRIENVAGNGYLVIGNFGGAAFIAKYNLIGQLQWSFNCKSEDWFFAGLKVDGTQVTKDAVESVELTDLIKTAAATVNTDFYISGTYTLSASGVKKGFVRRINISTDGLSIVSSSNGFVSFDEFTKINRIKLSTQYILAVGYLENSDGTTKGKIDNAI